MTAEAGEREDLVVATPAGLFCPAGGFHVDPWRSDGVDRAVVTHAHTDHLRDGPHRVLVAERGLGLARRRAPRATVEGVRFGERVRIGRATVSLHPAGHVLGAAQVRIEVDGRVWIVSGDYKRAADPTADAFEPVACETFISECTFGLPVYRWEGPEEIAAELNAWWAAAAADGRNAIVGAYALGKAQRVLAMADRAIGPIAAHGAVRAIVAEYRAAGIDLPELVDASADLRGALVVAPPSAIGSPWARKFGDASLAIASGWMRVRGMRRRSGVDRGLVVSDHADWEELNRTVAETGCRRVLFTHGSTDEMARFWREKGLDAGTIATRFAGERIDAKGHGEPEPEDAADA
jgi:putative mRNA 3-end processing factor